jgi:diacylglycerol kinase (ATP)
MGEESDTSTRETLVIVNPHASGGHNRHTAKRIEKIIQETASAARVLETQSAEHATDALLNGIARRSKVIVAGGDGTVNSVLEAVIECEHVLGVLPLGSGNDAARALGTFGGDLRATLIRLLTSESIRRVDVGLATFDDQSKHFLVSLNAGFDASIAARALNGPKWLRGLPRYLFATLGELVAIRHWNVIISLDGESRYTGTALFTSTLNAPTFGSGMPAVPHARIDDRKLDLLVARRFTRGGALVMLPRLLRGTHLNDLRVSTHQFSTLQLASEAPIPVAADGEFLGEYCQIDIAVDTSFIWAIE